jgi:hypothetical protein
MWKLLQERFTVESRNRLQVHLNTLGQFEMTDSENLKQMVDRFNKVMGEIRSIDASQLPTDLNLMGILKNAVKKVPILYAFLEYHQSPNLMDFLSMVTKWNLDDKATDSSAVANYTNLPGNLKKAYGKKQRSGRGGGKDDVARVVKENRTCLVCDRKGHIVRDCKDPRKRAWVEKRRRQQDKPVKKSRDRSDSDSDRGRKRERYGRERSGSRDRSPSRERSQSRDRDRNDRRARPTKKNKHNSGKWMDSDVKELSSSDESANMIFEDVGNDVALHALMDTRTDRAAIDSGANKLIVTGTEGIQNIRFVANQFLSTAS